MFQVLKQAFDGCFLTTYFIIFLRQWIDLVRP